MDLNHLQDRRRGAVACVLILGLALALRLAMALLFASRGADYWVQGDLQYAQIADHIAQGDGHFADGGFMEGVGGDALALTRCYSIRSPLFPFFLAGLYRLGGKSPLLVATCLAFVSTLTVGLVGAVIRRLFSARVALLAMLIAAVYPYSLIHDVRTFDTALFECLLAGSLLLLLRTAWTGGARNAVATGLLMGLTTLCRSNFLVFTPFLMGYMLLVGNRSIWRKGLLAGGIVLAQLLVLTPWIARNDAIHGTPVLSTYGGWNFLLGNSEASLPQLQRRLEADGVLSRRIRESGDLPADLSEVDADRWFYQRALAFIRENPGTFLRLLGLKTLNLWSVQLSPRTDSRAKDAIYSLSYGPLLILAVAGMVLGRRDGRRQALLYLLFLALTVSTVPFYPVSRHRKPLDAYLAAFAALTVLRVLHRDSPEPADARPPNPLS